MQKKESVNVKIPTHYLFWGILLFLISCSHPDVTFEKKELDGNSILVKRTFDKKGKILSEEQLSIDSIRNGSYKEFNNGITKIVGRYQDGKKDGSWYNLDLKGDTIDVRNWFDGKLFGEQEAFFMGGTTAPSKQLYKYSFIGLEGQKLFDLSYDTKGKRTGVSGLPVYCAYNKSDIQKDSMFELICFFGIPPNFTYKIMLSEKNKGTGNHELREPEANQIIDAGFAKKILTTKKYSLPGNYSWTVSLKIMDQRNEIICNDSTTIDLAVR